MVTGFASLSGGFPPFLYVCNHVTTVTTDLCKVIRDPAGHTLPKHITISSHVLIHIPDQSPPYPFAVLGGYSGYSVTPLILLAVSDISIMTSGYSGYRPYKLLILLTVFLGL